MYPLCIFPEIKLFITGLPENSDCCGHRRALTQLWSTTGNNMWRRHSSKGRTMTPPSAPGASAILPPPRAHCTTQTRNQRFCSPQDPGTQHTAAASLRAQRPGPEPSGTVFIVHGFFPLSRPHQGETFFTQQRGGGRQPGPGESCLGGRKAQSKGEARSAARNGGWGEAARRPQRPLPPLSAAPSRERTRRLHRYPCTLLPTHKAPLPTPPDSNRPHPSARRGLTSPPHSAQRPPAPRRHSTHNPAPPLRAALPLVGSNRRGGAVHAGGCSPAGPGAHSAQRCAGPRRLQSAGRAGIGPEYPSLAWKSGTRRRSRDGGSWARAAVGEMLTVSANTHGVSKYLPAFPTFTNIYNIYRYLQYLPIFTNISNACKRFHSQQKFPTPEIFPKVSSSSKCFQLFPVFPPILTPFPTFPAQAGIATYPIHRVAVILHPFPTHRLSLRLI